MRRLFFELADRLGVISLFRFAHRNGLTILLYHGVAPKVDSGICNYRGKFIEPAHFEKHMRFFAKHYHLVDLEDGVRMLREGVLPAYSLAITFDDGYRNFYEYAFPVLRAGKIPATMYLATDFVFDKKPLWVDRLEYAIGKQSGARTEKIKRDAMIRDELKKLPDEIRESRLREIESASVALTNFAGDAQPYVPLSKEEIQEMSAAGIVFGAHSKSHPILSRISPERQKEELSGSRAKVIEACGAVSGIFAYPNGQPGDWNDATETALVSAGFTGSLTTVEGVSYKDTPIFRLKRMTMDGTDSGAAFASVASGMRLFLSSIKHYVR